MNSSCSKRQCTYNVTLRRIHETIVAVETQYILHISVGGWEGRGGACVRVAFLTEHATRMRRNILSSVASLAAPYFSTLSHINGTIFGKKLLTIKICFDFFYNVYMKHFSV
jgi:hypothetical protein